VFEVITVMRCPCTAQMRELGAGVLMGLFQFGSLPDDLARKNIERFAERVLPKLARD
jgi:hypothetical protein